MQVKKIVKAKWFKYAVATLIFLVVILFLDTNNLMVTRKLHRQLSDLKAQEQELREAIAADSVASMALQDNPDAKERYGRENYYMKRKNEDIFVLK